MGLSLSHGKLKALWRCYLGYNTLDREHGRLQAQRVCASAEYARKVLLSLPYRSLASHIPDIF